MHSSSILPLLFGLTFVSKFGFAQSLPPITGFVTRNGSNLHAPELGDKVFKYGGGNAYWMGLDENELGVHFPTKFRIVDALTTFASLGIPVVRAHSLGISTGNPLSFETSLDVFNSSNLDAADYTIYMAGQLGIRLIIPLTDNYHYYHGGKHDFTDWLNKPETEFYTNPTVISAFERYINARLTHVNPYTNRMAKDEPSILAWETGNELLPPPAWTETIASYIKNTVQAKQLVLDGHYGIDKSSLSNPSVDLYSDHFYPVNTQRLLTGAQETIAANKVYIAGEYGWNSGDVTGFLAAAQGEAGVTGITGTNFWSLFPHADLWGFVQHQDSFTIHFPGDNNTQMTSFVNLLRSHAGNMTGRGIIPYPPPLTPTITAGHVANNTLTWQGAAVASTYSIDFSTSSSNGPWTNICENCATDNQTPFVLPSGEITSGVWYRVAGTNPEGVIGSYSPSWQCC